MYYFYILHSKLSDKYYIGSTSDLEGRLRRHNTNHKGFTGKYSDWELVYSEEYYTKKEALKRERFVKNKKSKIFIRNLIESKRNNQ